MQVLLINSVCGIGSTGKICGAIAEDYEKDGHQVKIAYGRDATVPERYARFAVRIGTDRDVKLHGLRTRLLDDHGFGSKAATKRFLAWADQFDPDVLWLHNIHGYYIHIGLLFDWIKSRPQMQVKWTLHDCWAFTGHCPHFTIVRCDRWKTQCRHCPQKSGYPGSMLLDRSQINYTKKKALFTGVKNMTLITPSQWLADLTRQSFLREYPVEVHHNTIDKNIFKPTPSDFRERYGLRNRKLILGVSSVWNTAKGLEDFYRLRELLDERYAIVLVGLTPAQIAALPAGILGIERTHDPRELAQIYTAADVFVNPSREETFGLTTLEAVSCGTHAIVYKHTACEEVVTRYGGIAVEDTVPALLAAITAHLGV